MSDSKQNYTMSAPNGQGEFDVVPAVTLLTEERLKEIIKEVLRNGTITRDIEGNYHFSEKGQPNG